MAKDFAKRFYGSKKWCDCRKSYITERVAVDSGLCEICHESLGYIVHHKKMINEHNITNPDITLSFDNLQYVCKECHDSLEGHGISRKQKMLVFFDKKGNPVGKISKNTPLSEEI